MILLRERHAENDIPADFHLWHLIGRETGIGLPHPAIKTAKKVWFL
jgi:hypothetical protein